MADEVLDLDSVLDIAPIDEGEYRPMLNSFTGTVESVEGVRDEKNNRTLLVMMYGDLEDVESTTPYEFPVAEIRFAIPRIGPRGTINKTNAYAVFISSAKKFIDPLPSWRELKGKRLKVAWTDGHDLFNPQRGGKYVGHAWEVVGVVGGSNGATAVRPADETALALLDGKTRQKFNTEALKDAVIRADTKLTTDIVSGNWLKSLEADGKVVKAADGVYSVVQ